MREIIFVISLALICGCLHDNEPITLEKTVVTSTTLDDEFIYVVPDTTTDFTTTLPASVETRLGQSTTTTTLNPLIQTFRDNKGQVCKINGKPIIRMYSKRNCSHCMWSGPIFDKVARQYMGEDQIVAHHWIFDRKDDLLTEGLEGDIPGVERNVFLESNQTTVPYFSFGCRFTRVGNGYQIRNLPDLEEREYQAVIEQVIEG